MKRIFFVIMLLLFASTAEATYWYCSEPAAGSADGTSWANAWNCKTGASGAVVWGGSGVVAGDTLFIDGGSGSKTYTATANNMFTVGAAGTAGNVITIATGAKSPSPTGHDGVVYFDGNATYNNLIYALREYVTLDGEKSGAINWHVHNTVINGSNWTGDYAISLSANDADRAGRKVTYLQVYDAMNGIQASGPADVAGALEISYCNLYNIYGDQVIRAAGDAPTGFGRSLIHHNIIRNRVRATEGGPDGLTVSRGADIYNNTFKLDFGTTYGSQHPDSVQCPFSDIRIYNNSFDGQWTEAMGTIGYQVIAHACGTKLTRHFEFYNNVVTRSGSEGVTIGPQSGCDYSPTTFTGLVANNTCVDMWNGTRCFSFTFEGLSGIPSVLFKNNIVYNAGTPGWIQPIFARATSAQIAGVTFSHNLVNAGASGGTICSWNDGSDHTWTQTNGQTGAPSFTSYSEYSLSNDYSLSSSDTAAKDHASSTGLTSYYTTDITGATRPGTWDIGAYEYGAGVKRTLFRR